MKRSRFLKQLKQKSISTDLSRIMQVKRAEQQGNRLNDQEQEQGNDLQLVNKSKLIEFTVVATHKRQLVIIFHPQLEIVGFVDQHAMHERVRYEYFLRKFKDQSVQNFQEEGIEKYEHKKDIQVAGQSTKTLKLIGSDEEWPQSCKESEINMWGFRLTRNSSGIYLVRFIKIWEKIPSDEQLKRIGRQILLLSEKKSTHIPKTIDHILGETACKSAIKFGDEVSKEWCIHLLMNASACDFPWFCVHGRPTVFFKKIQTTRKQDFDLL